MTARTTLALATLLLAALAACGPHGTPTPTDGIEGDTLAPFQMQTLHPADEDHR